MQTSDSGSTRPRWPLVLALVGFFVVVGAGALAAFFVWGHGKDLIARALPHRQPPPSGSAAAQARVQRQTPVAEIAPAPVPTALPLVGTPGHDADGYPTQYVDRPALRSLLWHERYAELTRYLEQFQQEFEADPKREYWPSDAGDVFDSAEPSLLKSLDAWVAATPDSFAPYFARATYWTRAAYARRGGKYASDTPGDDFGSMREAVRNAVKDLDRTLSLRPKVVHATVHKINMLKLENGRDAIQREIEKATALCPTCFRARVAYINSLTPRWGGSYPEMQAYADKTAGIANPKLRFLKGYIDLDKAEMFSSNKDYDRALQAIQRACALGDHWQFLRERADIQMRRDDDQHALADLDRALSLRPGLPALLIDRALVRVGLKQWEAAGNDLLGGLRVDPTSSYGREIFGQVLQGVIYDAWEHHRAGRRNDALRVIEIAAELAPTNREVQSRKTAIIEGATPDAGGGLAALEQAAAQAPDDFRAVQQLGYALVDRGQFDRLVKIWDAYIGRNPNDGRAYLERGGGYFRLRKLAEAGADATKACSLGVSEGCARAKQVGAR